MNAFRKLCCYMFIAVLLPIAIVILLIIYILALGSSKRVDRFFDDVDMVTGPSKTKVKGGPFSVDELRTGLESYRKSDGQVIDAGALGKMLQMYTLPEDRA